MANEEIDTQEPEKEIQDPVVASTPPDEESVEEKELTKEELEEVHGGPIPVEGSGDAQSELPETVVAEEEVDVTKDAPDPGQVVPMTREQKNKMEWEKLGKTVEKIGETTVDVVTAVPEAVIRGGLTVLESATEGIVNITNSIGKEEGALDKRINLDYPEMFFPKSTVKEALGDMTAFMMLFATPLPGEGAALAKLGDAVNKVKGSSTVLKSVIEKGDKLSKSIFRISGGRANTLKGLKGAFLMPADTPALVTNKSESVGELEGRLKTMVDELVISPVVGGSIKAFQYFKNVIIPTTATQVKATEMLEEGISNAKSQKEIDEVVDTVEEFVDQRVAEVKETAKKQLDDDIAEIKGKGETVEEVSIDDMGIKELRQYVSDKGLKSKARTADELRTRIKNEEALNARTEAEKIQAELQAKIDNTPLEQIRKENVDLAKLFKNPVATKELARLINVRVTKEGGKGKHRKIGEIQQDVADFFQQPLPPNTGVKPSDVPVNVSTRSTNFTVQQAWRSLPSGAKNSIEDVDKEVVSHSEMLSELETHLNNGGYVEDLGALGTLADRVAGGLRENLVAWRVLDAAVANRISKLSTTLDDALKGAKTPEERTALLAEYTRQVDEVAEEMAIWKRGQMDIARELGFMRNVSDQSQPVQVLTNKEIASTPEDFQKYLEEAFPGEDVGKAAEHFMRLRKSLEQIARMDDTGKLSEDLASKGSGYSGIMMKILSGQYINSMLASAKTFVVNFVSPAFVNTSDTLEKAINNAFKGEGKQALIRIKGMLGTLDNVAHSIRMAKSSFKNNDSLLDSGYSSVDDFKTTGNSVVESVTGRPAETNTEKFLDLYNNTVTVPGRALMSADELWKNLIYRKELATLLRIEAFEQGVKRRAAGETVTDDAIFQEAWRKATLTDFQYTRENLFRVAEETAEEQGLKRGTKEFNDFTSKYMLDNYDSAIANTAKQSLETSRDVTFTAPLEEPTSAITPFGVRSMIGEVQNSRIMNQWFLGPILRSQVPFIRVPTNILAWYADRQIAAPIRGFRDLSIGVRQGWRKLRSTIDDDINYVPRTAKEAVQQQKNMGKLTTGLGFTYMAYNLAMSGTVSGGGPTSSQMRRAWEAEGWKPYSIKVGDEWVSYLRGDPASMFLGSMADAVESLRFVDGVDNLDEIEIDDLLFTGAASIYKQLDDRTFFRGIENLITLASSDDDFAKATALKNTVGNIVPYGNMLNSLKKFAGDDYQRYVDPDQEVFAFMVDSWKSKIPGLSKELEPRFDFLGNEVESSSAWQGPDLLSPIAPPEEWNNIFNPILASKMKDSVVYKEIMEQSQPWSEDVKHFPLGVPNKVINFEGVRGINLQDYEYEHYENGKKQWTGTLWSRYQWLVGHTKMDGMTLEESLEDMILNDELYKETADYFPDKAMSGDEDKISLIQERISEYRQEALIIIADDMYARKDEPELRKLGLMLKLREATSDMLFDRDKPGILEVRKLMEELLGSEEGAVKASEYLRQMGIDTSDIE